MLISFCHFKHNTSNTPHTIPVEICSDNPSICAVNCLKQFLVKRGSASGPLFLSRNGSLLLRSRFDKITKLSLAFCGLDSSRYKGHSFRIGGASEAARKGYTDSQIRFMGRWKSDAFKKYIRSPALNFNS